MTPSDLLELTSQLEFSKRCRWQTNRSYCSPVIREEDVDHILKSLRFAADMERLASCCGNIRLHQNGGSWYVDADRLDGENIHSVENHRTVADAVAEAARKAVEALEGKE